MTRNREMYEELLERYAPAPVARSEAVRAPAARPQPSKRSADPPPQRRTSERLRLKRQKIPR